MDKKLSVAIIAGYVGKSPEEVAYSFIFDEAYRLAQRGLNVHVVRSRIEEDSLSYGIHFHGIERRIDIQVLDLLLKNITNYPLISFLRNPKRLYWENLYALNVSKVIERNDVNLIHAHFAYPEGLVGLIAKKYTGVPLIVTSHGYDLNVIKEYRYGVRIYPQYDALTRLVMRESDCIIVPSNLLYKKALEAGAKPSKTFLIPNAVDTNIFRPNLNGHRFRKKYRLGNDPIVLTIRALKPWYHIEKILSVAKIVLKKIKCNFVVIGEGEMGLKLSMLAKKFGMQKIHFIRV